MYNFVFIASLVVQIQNERLFDDFHSYNVTLAEQMLSGLKYSTMIDVNNI